MHTLVSTERLYVRHLERSDHAFILRLVNSPGWLQYIGDRNIHTAQAAKDYIQHQQDGYQTFRFGLSAVCLQENNDVIGLCGFLKREELPHQDIGFALLPDYKRKGYASEIVRASLAKYWETHSEEPVLAQVQFDNQASIGLLKKLGFEQWDYPVSSNKTLLLKRYPD